MSKKTLNKGKKQFLIRLVIFLASYALISFFYKDLKTYLDQGHYQVNENYISKFIYFLVIFIIYLRRKKIAKLPEYRNSIIQTLGFTALAVIFFTTSPGILIELGLTHKVAYFLLYGLGQLSAFLAIFNSKIFSIKFLQEEILFGLMILLIILATHFIVNSFWPIFFTPLAWTLTGVLPLLSETTQVTTLENGFSVTMNEFAVDVGPPCAGIYSMIAFSLLFLTAIYFSKQKFDFNRNKIIIAFVSGLAVIYILNIIRIALIIFVGAYFSREIAIDLFHEYLSAIFLMATFIIYINYVIPKLAVNTKTKKSSK